MKRKFALVLAAAVAVSAATVNSFADGDYPEVALIIDGEEVESDQPAVIVDSRTMVPVRVIAEALGCEVDWDGETKTVTVTSPVLVADDATSDAAEVSEEETESETEK